MYFVEFSKNAKKQLDKLSEFLKRRIVSTLDRIKIRPYHFVKRKQGTPYYILRIGNYRTILDIKKDKLLIFVIELGHRRNIYE
ncbi:hypothetical protein ES703_80116 [subsurface metagenome]